MNGQTGGQAKPRESPTSRVTGPGASTLRGEHRSVFRPSFPLVKAKLRPRTSPPVTVPRERLIRQLTAEPRKSIVSVTAPPGYGKTVLLSQWVAQEERDVAWLTLDDLDNDPSVFLTNVASSLDRVRPIDASMGAAIAVHGHRVLATAVPRIAWELSRWEQPGLLVLDDVHQLTDRICLDALAQLLDLLPPGFQVAMAARVDLDLPLARYRARQALLELGGADLALDPEETLALVSAMGEPLDATEARLLSERAEGWAAGTYLMTLERTRHGGGRDAADISGGVGYVAEYLRVELERDLSDHDVALLTRTSILEVVEPSLAESVAAVPHAEERLGSLAHANQLIGRVEGPDVAFRYHALLRDFLSAELERREPGTAPELHRRAAAWYADSGRMELAIEHALAGGDMDGAAPLVTAAVLSMHHRGHDDRLQRWLGSFDDRVVARHPSLAVVAAWIYAVNGRPGAADHMADIAEQFDITGAPDDGASSFGSSKAMLRAALARNGPAAMLSDAALAATEEERGRPWRMYAFTLVGWAHRLLGEADAADAAFAEAVASARVSGVNPFIALASQASNAIHTGDWHSAERLAQDSHEEFMRTNLGEIASSLLAHAVVARVAIHNGDQPRGRAELVHAQLARPQATYALPWLAVAALLDLAHAYLAISDATGARSTVAEAARIARRRPQLGTLIVDLDDIRQKLADASETLVGSSALTPAELRLLPFLSTYLTFEEIAGRLSLSRHTIKSQAVAVYAKLQATSRSQAVERAIELGLIEPLPGLLLARGTPDD